MNMIHKKDDSDLNTLIWIAAIVLCLIGITGLALSLCGCKTIDPTPIPVPPIIDPDPIQPATSGFDWGKCKWMGHYPISPKAEVVPHATITGASLRGSLMYFSYAEDNVYPAWAPTFDSFCIGPFACAWQDANSNWVAGAIDYMAIKCPSVHDAGNLLKTTEVPWSSCGPAPWSRIWVTIYSKDGKKKYTDCEVVRK
jgi:hypothetical protein